jgi:hypothetical protein
LWYADLDEAGRAQPRLRKFKTSNTQRGRVYFALTEFQQEARRQASEKRWFEVPWNGTAWDWREAQVP